MTQSEFLSAAKSLMSALSADPVYTAGVSADLPGTRRPRFDWPWSRNYKVSEGTYYHLGWHRMGPEEWAGNYRGKQFGDSQRIDRRPRILDWADDVPADCAAGAPNHVWMTDCACAFPFPTPHPLSPPQIPPLISHHFAAAYTALNHSSPRPASLSSLYPCADARHICVNDPDGPTIYVCRGSPPAGSAEPPLPALRRRVAVCVHKVLHLSPRQRLRAEWLRAFFEHYAALGAEHFYVYVRRVCVPLRLLLRALLSVVGHQRMILFSRCAVWCFFSSLPPRGLGFC